MEDSMKRNPESVKSNLFQSSPFFDPSDSAQVKYEMLRAHCHEQRFISRACREFGYSRESFYQALEAFRAEGLPGLVDKPRGKTKPDKVTPEIIGFVIYQRAKYGLSGAGITEQVREVFNIPFHKRTIERILGHYGILDL
jgi:transposase